MTDNMKAFLEKISGDEKLSETLNSLEAPEKIVDLAKQLGFDISKEELDGAVLGGDDADAEIDLEEADAVAGGKACVCIFGGGSKGNDNKDNHCACIGAGTGENKDFNNRCGCIIVGVGNECTYEGKIG